MARPMSISCALLALLLYSILGNCEMSVYPGLRRRPNQQAAMDNGGQYELNSDFLAQLMEENARRRLQQQFEQQLELIKLKMQRQRQLLERERYRQRQQELQVLAESENDYENNLNNQQYDQYDNIEAESSYGSPLDAEPEMPRLPTSFMGSFGYLPQRTTTTNTNNYNNNLNNNNNNNKERIPFAVGPNDERFFDNPSDPSGELDSRALDDYEEYSPLLVTSAKPAILAPAPAVVEPPKLLDTSAANFHRIKPQTAAAAAVAGVNLPQSQPKEQQQQQHEITALIDKLQKQGKSPALAPMSSHPALASSSAESSEQIVLRQQLGINTEMGVYIVALIAGVSAAVTVGLLALGVTWFHNRKKAAADVDYPAYGVTGPNKDVSPSGDRKLAQSAQMYHYQHQKQQIIAMENCQATDGSCGLSDVESDDDNEEGDYTVYECPGLAPTGEMEVKNPLFLDDTPAATPAAAATTAAAASAAAAAATTNNNITQATPQQPATVKKGTVKPNINLMNATAAAAEKNKKKTKK